MLDFLHQDKDSETGKVMRRVRSVVLREGRLTHGQRKALDTLWPRYGLERAQGVLDARAEFRPRRAPGAGNRLRHGPVPGRDGGSGTGQGLYRHRGWSGRGVAPLLLGNPGARA
jgi:Predicted S-adenosylmethionine-dependent methyltransferase